MMQPISGTPARPPGEGQNAPSAAGEQPLSTQQRTVLERLITRLISLTQQQKRRGVGRNEARSGR